MGKFRDWVRQHHETFGDRYGIDNDKAGDYENDLKNLAKLLMNSYHEDFSDFLNDLLSKTGNSELEEMIERISQTRKSAFRNGDLRVREPEEVMAPAADRGGEGIE